MVFVFSFFSFLFANETTIIKDQLSGNDSPKIAVSKDQRSINRQHEKANNKLSGVGAGYTIHIDVSETFTCGETHTYNFDVPNVTINNADLLIYGSDYDADNDGDYTDFYIKVNGNDVIPWATPLETYGLPVNGNFGEITFDITSDVVVGANELYLENTEYTGQPDYTVIDYVEIIINGGGGNPDISVIPTSLSETLQTGETAAQTLTISNNGDGDLNFNISIEENVLANIIRQRHERNLIAPVEPIYPNNDYVGPAKGGQIEGEKTPDVQLSPADDWVAYAGLNDPRAQHVIVNHPNGKIYVFGGYTGVLITTLEIYDPATNSWSYGNPMPVGDRGMGYAIDNNGYIYSFSALGESFSYRYNPVTDTWTQINEPPQAHLWQAAATLGNDGRIYLIGGEGSGASDPLNLVQIYNPATNSWTTGSPMPTARYGLGVVKGPGGFIYAIGGRNSSADGAELDVVEVYDPVTNTWSSAAPMPTPRWQFATSVGSDGKIYTIGGKMKYYNHEGPFYDVVEIYDPVTNSWETGPAYPMEVGEMNAARMNNQIFVTGGSNGAAINNTYGLVSGGGGWISVNPTSGIIPPGLSQDIEVIFDASELEIGLYDTTIVIYSNDPDEPRVTVPATLQVTEGICDPPYIKVVDVFGIAGDTLEIEINILDNPNPIDALGFQFTYCDDKLSFVRVEKGTLTDHFSFFQGNENQPGTVTIGGFDATAVPALSNGSIAKVFLRVDQCAEGQSCILGIQNLTDDLIGLNICSGVWTCQSPCLLGDTNDDGDITAGDALCAFRYFLGSVPPDCPCVEEAGDVNCTPDGITPGDALYIFLAYLNDWEPPIPCNPTQVSLSNSIPSQQRRINLTQIASNSYDEITFALKIDNPAGIRAFGLNLGYPNDILTFDRVTRTNLTDDWEALDGKESLDGVLNIGGFNVEAINKNTAGELVHITFRIKQGISAEGEIWLYNLCDDVAGVEVEPTNFTTVTTGVRSLFSPDVPLSYSLEQNYPNPFNLETEIIYQIPKATHVQLELYNSMGQKIRTLVSQHQSAGRYAARWDGRDESGNVVSSGVYIYKFKTTDFTSIKKLTLIK